MTKFSYQAINEIGNVVSGELDAPSADTARNILAGRGYIPSKIKELGREKSAGRQLDLASLFIRVRTPDLILFSKQLGTMLRAGIPVLRLFQVLQSQTENRRLKSVIGHLIQDIQEGSTIHEAMRKHPGVFSPLYCSMVRAGEASGSLSEVLDRLIYIIEHEHKIRSDIKAALTYPIIVLVFLGIAFFVLLTFVIPKFVRIFEAAKIDLPLPTKFCIFLNMILSNYWHVIIAAFLVTVAALIVYFRTEQGRYIRDLILVRVPHLGSLFVKASMSRFASIFAILQSSGVSVLETLGILSDTIGNAAISREFDRIGDQLREGRGISDPLKSARHFTPMVINMVAIGEESGNLDTMLREVASHYDAEVEYAMNRLTAIIGPVLTIGLAAMVGFFALAIFLPMWDLTKMLR